MANYVPVEPIPRFNIELSPKTWRRDAGVVGSFLVIGVFVSAHFLSNSPSQPMSNPQVAGASVVEAATVAPTETPAPSSLPDISAQLQRQLDNVLQQSNLQYSLSLVSLRTGHTFGRNEHAKMVGASTTKLITAAAVLHLVDQGKLQLSQQVGGLILQEQLRLMINRSNNSAWITLNSLVGKKQLQAYANAQGWSEFQVSDNQISAANLADLLTRLDQGKLLLPQSTQLLLGLMNNTNEERLIPAGAGGAEVFHKYGWVDGNVNDAAIINLPNQPVVLVLLTNNEMNQDLATRAPIFVKATQDIIAAVNKGW